MIQNLGNLQICFEALHGYELEAQIEKVLVNLGFSRDDVGTFMPAYIDNHIIASDPFQVLDAEGVGELIKIAIKKARANNQKIKIGICGEHGGDPQSIKFLYDAGVNYVSCSPYRIPIAYLTLAQLSSTK